MPTRILMLSRYSRMGASSRIRFYQYVPYLEAHGIEVTTAHLLGDDYLNDIYAGKAKSIQIIVRSYWQRLLHLFRSKRYDLLWIQAELFPWSPAWGERALAMLGIPYVVDYDDAVFHYYDIHANRIVRALFGRKIDTVMRKAVLVVAGNEYLASRARQAGAKEVATLPSVVDASRYEVIEAQGKQRLTIGWIGSPTTALFLHACRKALGHAVTHYDARLVLIGSGSIQVGKLPLEIQPWSEDTETTAIKAFDIGIMPMPDNPWTRGKCGYKLIQYMASGIPVIASPVGVNSDIVEHGHNGFLATEPEEWIEALSRLISDADLRARMGAAGRAKVDTEYSLQIMAPKLLAILEQAVRH